MRVVPLRTCVPPRKISLHREKGAAFLSLVLVMALVSGMLSLSSAKMSQAAMNANGSHSIAMQAGAYASGKAEILKKEAYSDLKNQGKTSIANSDGFYDEVSVGAESVYDAEKNIKQKECQIRVYHKDDALPRSTIKLIRYSAESTSSSVPQGSIIPWYGSPGNIPNGFALCDGKNGTPDLRNRFIVGAGNTYKLSDIGGKDAVTLEPSQTSSHYHTFGYHNGNNNGYFITTASKKTNASLPSGTYPAKWNGSGGGGWYGWDGSGWNGGQNLVTSLTVATEAQKPHENRPPYYALYYLMKL